ENVAAAARYRVQAPTPDRAVVAQRVAVEGARRNGTPTRVGKNLERAKAIARRAVANLAVVVLPPRPERAVRFQCHHVTRADAEFFPIVVAIDSHRGVGHSTFGRVAQFALTGVTPTP